MDKEEAFRFLLGILDPDLVLPDDYWGRVSVEANFQAGEPVWYEVDYKRTVK